MCLVTKANHKSRILKVWQMSIHVRKCQSKVCPIEILLANVLMLVFLFISKCCYNKVLQVCGLKQQKFILEVLGLEVEIEVIAWTYPWRLLGGILPCFFPALMVSDKSLAYLDLSLHHSSLCLHCPMALSPDVYLSL